ncbi:MAG: ChaN family lipoprotein, partial [Rhodospirillales bacterium]|nr:ChaN family lipoprotein [Rhodospirillales bacterium]
LCACAMPPTSDAQTPSGAACAPTGTWFDPATGNRLVFQDLIDRLAAQPVVLLGETHTSVADHRWQLHVLAALHSRNPDMAIGFEAFPRRLQPVLDQWVSGKLSQRQFLADSEWQDVWGFSAELYMPLFDFARMNRLPMIALNVDRSLVARVGKEGWDAVPLEERQGLGTPATAPAEYRDSLGRVYAQHRMIRKERSEDQTDRDEPELPLPDPDDPAFARFVQAQLTWDRAMAEAIATSRGENDSRQVIGIIGRGHVDYGFGVAHQLVDLGSERPSLLATWTSDRDCAALVSEGGVPIADALFAVSIEAETETTRAPRGPKLGVLLSETRNGVRIDGVVEGSVAEQAGMLKGDLVRKAAGREIAKPGDFASIIRSMPHGAWLPMDVERDGRSLELVAKFPARPHPPLEGPSPHRPTSKDR